VKHTPAVRQWQEAPAASVHHGSESALGGTVKDIIFCSRPQPALLSSPSQGGHHRRIMYRRVPSRQSEPLFVPGRVPPSSPLMSKEECQVLTCRESSASSDTGRVALQPYILSKLSPYDGGANGIMLLNSNGTVEPYNDTNTMYLQRILLLLLTTILITGCSALRDGQIGLPTDQQRPTSTATSLPQPTSTQTTVPSAHTTVIPTQALTPIATIEPTPTLAPLSREQRLDIFQQVWETVRDNYLYEDFNGLDWNAVRAELQPKVEAAATPEAFYTIMREMIARLGDDHSRFESPQEVAAQMAEARGQLQYGGIGVSVRTIEEGGLITRVVPGGPADQAGILPRDVILAVNGIPFNDNSAFGPEGAIGAVRGLPGTSVRLTIKRGREEPREIELVRAIIDIAVFNQVTAKRLAGDIGLLHIPSFYVDNADTQTRDALTTLLAEGPLRGIIIDVRDNSGGYIHVMRNIIALFHDGGSIGASVGRNEREEQRIPRGRTISGLTNIPVVVLISDETASAAEMFTAGMRLLRQATIVGVPSAGNTENLYGYNFSDGSRLLLAEVAYQLPDGTLIEGTGIIPDVLIEAEWWRFDPEDDPQLQVALKVLTGAQ